MALSASTLAAVREWVGSSPPDGTLEDHYARHGNVHRVALAVLRARLADAIELTDLDVDGFVSEGSPSTEAIKAMRARVAQLEGIVGAVDADPDPDLEGVQTGGLSVGRLRRRYAR